MPEPPTAGLDRAWAPTPPMGWNNWNATGCSSTFGEQLVLQTADRLLSTGLADAGYTYLNIDDCWALPARDADGDLVPDPARFPRGIAAVAADVHARGLKFGIYSSAGSWTCSRIGFPGSLDHEERDARRFAAWGVDYLKYDNCHHQGRDPVERYVRMRDALAATGRPIVYSICEWGENKPWTWAGEVGHLWRTTGDIEDNWASLHSIVQQNMVLADHAGPGRWNDPDMLEIGNGGLTGTECRTQLSLWAVMAAPLLIGCDLRTASPDALAILLAPEVIAIDQDPLGAQGRPLRSAGGQHVLVKPLAGGDRAIALFNEGESAVHIATTAAEAGLAPAARYRVRDLWSHTTTETAGTVEALVPAHGTTLVRVRALW